MQLLGFDYARDHQVHHNGLAGLATMIRTARADAQNSGMSCMLVDNGDLLQGAPVGEVVAELPMSPDHPMVRSLTQMSYDALGLGNHDLDFGFPYLAALADTLPIPVVCSNLAIQGKTAIVSSSVITCAVPDEFGATKSHLRVGLVSALPEQTARWNAPQLAGAAEVEPPRQALTKAISEVRSQGADVVLLLAHMGADGRNPLEDARAFANLPGIDAMILGHTHLRLPGSDHIGQSQINNEIGAIGGRPAVMAGFDASDLALLDLTLAIAEDGKCRVIRHHTELRQNAATVPADPTIEAIFAPAHQTTRKALAQPCSRTREAIHNFFTLAVPTATCAMVASAKWMVVQQGLSDLPERHLPLLATASAHTAGGRSGPSNYLHIPPGDILRRHITGLSPYPNGITGLKVTGRELRKWLEHAAGVYTQLSPDRPDQKLLRADRPIFDFDTIYGLEYQIDPTQPHGQRISRLVHDDAPVEDDAEFALATNDFRAAGGGGGLRFSEAQTLFRSDKTVTEAIIALLQSDKMPFPMNAHPWTLDCAGAVKTVLRTSPEALNHLDEISHLSPEPIGVDPDGFARIQLTL